MVPLLEVSTRLLAQLPQEDVNALMVALVRNSVERFGLASACEVQSSPCVANRP